MAGYSVGRPRSRRATVSRRPKRRRQQEARMYATVRTYSSNPDLADALVSNEAAVKDLIAGIDGFKAYYLIRTGDGAVSISVYDDEAGANESTRAAAEWI